jgi:CheY-like chemotaxis protein
MSGTQPKHPIARLIASGRYHIKAYTNVCDCVTIVQTGVFSPFTIRETVVMSTPARSSILCVDNEEVPLLVRSKVLEEAGFVVFTAATVSEALACFKSHPVDLVITDHLLPGATGNDLALELRRINPKLPVLTLSGSQIPRGRVQPPDFYLHKLEGPAKMIAKVQSILLA